MFSNMELEKLIECVRDLPLLYDLEHKNYSDNDKKELAWKEIGRKFNRSPSYCKKQWYTLRDSYRRALKRKKETSGQLGAKNRRWKFDEEMLFLLPHLKEREKPTSVNMDLSDDAAGNDSARPLLASPIQNQASEKPTVQQQSDRPAFFKLTERRPNLALRKLSRPQQPGSSTAVKYTGDKQRDKQRPKRLGDIDYIFMGLAATVKKFSPLNQAIAKARIVKLVSDLEIEDLQQKSNATPNESSSDPVPISPSVQNDEAIIIKHEILSSVDDDLSRSDSTEQ